MSVIEETLCAARIATVPVPLKLTHALAMPAELTRSPPVRFWMLSTRRVLTHRPCLSDQRKIATLRLPPSKRAPLLEEPV